MKIASPVWIKVCRMMDMYSLRRAVIAGQFGIVGYCIVSSGYPVRSVECLCLHPTIHHAPLVLYCPVSYCTAGAGTPTTRPRWKTPESAIIGLCISRQLSFGCGNHRRSAVLRGFGVGLRSAGSGTRRVWGSDFRRGRYELRNLETSKPE